MLRGKTLFITGASRGIGKAIGLRAARDGANVVIAAKTVDPHPKLEGTIFSAAEEIEAAGGRALPVQLDIRSAEDVQACVEKAANHFGGIDVVVNNASAISLTGTEATPAKRYDLMHQVNGRGTFLTTQACVGHLKKSKNPHILTISPPLNMNPLWFKNHVAYTTAKYNMSMNAMGWAEEYRKEGIASNCLWPRTGIATAAMAMLGGEESLAACRKPEIMADAAHHILSADARQVTGEFFIDDEVLQHYEGADVDLDKYAHRPGAQLIPDFFLDEALDFQFQQSAPNTPTQMSSSASSPSAEAKNDDRLDALFQKFRSRISDNPSAAQKVNAVIRVELATDAGLRAYTMDLKNQMSIEPEGDPSAADCTVSMAENDFFSLINKELNPQMAFLSGKLKISGDAAIALRLTKIF